MRVLSFACVTAGALLSSVVGASAANVTSWVASTPSGGSDSNACSRTAPCATFAGALAQTVDGGTILCVDAGSFGVPGSGLTITQGIEIDCRNVKAVVEISGSTGVVINVTDPVNQSVTIRGVTITGRLGSNGRANTAGIAVRAARTFSLTDVLVEQFAQQGLIDTRSLQANGPIQLKNSSFAGNTGPGIVLAATTNNFSHSADLEDVYSGYNGYGIAVANGNRARITSSTFPYNAVGVELDQGGQVSISKTIIDYCSTAAFQNGGTVVAGENEITYVATVFTGSGLTYTNGNNRINYYSSLGNTPTGLPVSSDHGQQ